MKIASLCNALYRTSLAIIQPSTLLLMKAGSKLHRRVFPVNWEASQNLRWCISGTAPSGFKGPASGLCGRIQKRECPGCGSYWMQMLNDSILEKKCSIDQDDYTYSEAKVDQESSGVR